MAQSRPASAPEGTPRHLEGQTGGWVPYHPAHATAQGSQTGQAAGPQTHRTGDELPPGPGQVPVRAYRPYRKEVTQPKGHGSRRVAVALGVAGVAVCAVAVVVGLGILPAGRGGSAEGTGAALTQQAENANQGVADVAPSPAEEPEPEPAPQAAATSASDILGSVSSLSHAGDDCSLPTEGAEVDVLGGRVLVAYQTGENADVTLRRMTAAAAELAQQLAGTTLADSSTSEGGVSGVPASSTPAAIASSDGSGTAFSNVEVVAIGSGGYVVGAVVLSPSDSLATASEGEVLAASDSYAIEVYAYAVSGLSERGIAQTKGERPTLVTGEQVSMRLTAPAQQRQTTSSASTSSGTSSTRNATSGTSGSSRNGNGGSARPTGSSSSSSASSGSSRRSNSQSGSSGTGRSYAGNSGSRQYGQSGQGSSSSGRTGGSSAGSGSSGYGSSGSSSGYSGSGSTSGSRSGSSSSAQ